MADRSFKICSDWSSSHNVIKSNPIKNAYPPLLINKFIKKQPFKMLQRTLKRKFNIKVISNSFKIKNYFFYKDQIPVDLKSFLVYKFTCSCSSGYISEPCRHFKSRIEEHIKRITSLIFWNNYTSLEHALTRIILFSKIIDNANFKFDLKIIEGWRKLKTLRKTI